MFGKLHTFSNIECQVLDPSYVDFKECNLKVLGRGIVGLNVNAVLKQPLKIAKVNLSLWRKYNGYRPFMMNTTLDFCKFMAKTKAKLSFEKIVFDAIATQSNVNHTCPFEDIIVRNLVAKEEFFKFLPLPSGEYKFQVMASANNEWKAIVYVSILRKEDLLNN